jgi:hypothetical protein
MTRLQAFLLLGVVGFTAFQHYGLLNTAGIVAALWLLSPHGPKLG